MRSIRRYLVTVIIALLILISFLATLQGYRHSIARSDNLFDQQLVELARSLLDASAATAANDDTDAAVNVSNSSGQLAVQISEQQQLRFRTTNTPERLFANTPGFSEQNFSGQRWRTYLHCDPKLRCVFVAQPLSQRQELADEVVLSSISPTILSLPLLAVLIWLVISRGLTPLYRLVEQLQLKKSQDLSPLSLPEAPQELQPVLTTTNHLLARLDEAFSREKRFASDVAHELRTPLSVLKIDLYNLQQQWAQFGLPDEHQAIHALQLSVERMAELIEQILLLNRIHPEHFRATLQAQDVFALCQQVIIELYANIERKQQTISLEGTALVANVDKFALQVLMRNLINNANKYTPEQGEILISVSAWDGQWQFQVEDSGPGIADAEHDRVFDRFYRVGGDRHHSAIPGSGLGLAIVRHIVQLHHGSISLSRSRFASGLKVTVTLPC